jgi:AraC-like DNA-binding protein
MSSDMIIRPKHPLLQQMVEYFWTLEGEPASPELYTLIYPEPCFEILLSFASPTQWVSADHSIRLSHSFYCPVRTCYYDVHPQGRVEYLAIRFRPSSLPLISIPAEEFSNHAVALDDVLDLHLRQLIAPVYQMESMQERIAYLEQALTHWIIQSNPQSPPAFQHAIKLLHNSHGQVPIQTLCDQSGFYPRKLERQFNSVFGVSPKTYARILRFGHTIEALLKPSSSVNLDVLFQAGYADQAHFIRECREFTGRTPTEVQNLVAG